MNDLRVDLCLLVCSEFWATICPEDSYDARDLGNVMENLKTARTVGVELSPLGEDQSATQIVASLLEYRDEQGARPFAQVIDKIVRAAFQMGRELGRTESKPAK